MSRSLTPFFSDLPPPPPPQKKAATAHLGWTGGGAGVWGVILYVGCQNTWSFRRSGGARTAPASSSGLILCGKTVPLVLSTTDEPLFFRRFVLIASCARVQ